MQSIINQFIAGLMQTTWLEFVAVVAGIASVFFSRQENIWVYPVGLVNTTIYIYLSLQGHLYGEASVNFYYTAMSIYGWVLWSRRDQQHHHVLHITRSNGREWGQQLLFFGGCYLALFTALRWLQQEFAPEAIPWADALASASAYTGMWLMTRKKVESWYWWIATNVASIPLYFVKGYVFTSVYYLILLGMAVSGLMAWKKKAAEKQSH